MRISKGEKYFSCKFIYIIRPLTVGPLDSIQLNKQSINMTLVIPIIYKFFAQINIYIHDIIQHEIY